MNYRKVIFYPLSVLILFYVLISGYFYLIQERAIFPARTIPTEFKYDFSIQHQELFFSSTDGASINAVLFKAEQAKGAVLHFHGNAENMLNMEQVAAPFVNRGYDFLAIDYRTYGKSTGELTEAALFSDSMLAMQFLEQQGWQQSDIILYGRSIGTGIATQLASITDPKALILYSPYYSMESLVSDHYGLLPVNLILKFPLQTHQYLRVVTAPIMILHGKMDRVIPFTHAVRLEEIGGKLVSFPDGGHNNLSRKPQFWRAIDTFLSEI